MAVKHGDGAAKKAGDCINGHCFVAGTLVLTANGYKNVEDVEVGDKVIATDPETGETEIKEVKRVFENKTYELLHLTVNGETIVSTPGHKYYAPKKGWISAIELRSGDLLQLVNGEYVVVEAVQHEILETPVTIYNFEVEDFHTYYVGEQSVLVHNRDCRSKKAINLPSSKKVKIDMNEVLTGHTSSGYRAQQSQIKDLFPDEMSASNIEKEIRKAYGNAKQVGSPQFDGISTRIRMQGKGRNGIVEMWYNKTTRTIETAYPVYGKKVRIG